LPAAAIPIAGRRQGSYVILEAALPEQPVRNIGVLLIDPATGRGWARLREHYRDIASEEDAEVLEAIAAEMPGRMAESGAGYLDRLEDSLSNAIRVSDRHEVEVDAFTHTIDRLYRKHVDEAVDPYRTHVPLYSLRAAAGRLGEEMTAEAEDWVALPNDVRAAEGLFVARVEGHSMEPRIPDGSLNLFRFHPVGSRQSKIVLVERYGVLEESARYTVKRYSSRKAYRGEEEWQHEQIRLEPLNPAYEAWDVEPQDFAVVAEWLRVIE
jgi:SOS-response transcriptional repressor LexA